MAETFVLVDDVRPFPAAITLTGTVSSSGTTVTGTGTLFTTEILFQQLNSDLKYPHLYSEVNGEVMEIINVIDDTTLILKAAFSADLAGEDCMVTDKYAAIVSIAINPLGVGVKLGTLNQPSTAIDANTLKFFDNDNGITPIVVDATASDCEVTYS